jgi:cytochrome c peroxidase
MSLGVEGREGSIHSPSLLNVAYSPYLFWNGRSQSLESQVRYPLTHPHEMNTTPSRVVEVVSADPNYVEWFQKSFGRGPITFESICKAIAAFERTLVTADSAFDRFYFDHGPFSSAQKRGWKMFRGKAGCAQCHTFDERNPFFTDFVFHNTGIGRESKDADLGRYAVSGERTDKGKFRTPSLRNVDITAPYMHDGSLTTLEDVVRFYERGGNPNRFLDDAITPLDLDKQDRDDLVSFLRSLTSSVYVPPKE